MIQSQGFRHLLGYQGSLQLIGRQSQDRGHYLTKHSPKFFEMEVVQDKKVFSWLRLASMVHNFINVNIREQE